MLSGFFVPVSTNSDSVVLQYSVADPHQMDSPLHLSFRNFYRFQHSHRISCIRMVVLELQKLLNIGK